MKSGAVVAMAISCAWSGAAAAHEVNARGEVVLVDPVFDHPARPRNELGLGTRLLGVEGDGRLGGAWAVIVQGEVGLEETATAGLRAAVLEHADVAPGGPALRGLASLEAWAGLALYRIGYPWRVFMTPAVVVAAERSLETDGWTFRGRAELRAGVGVEGLPGFTFFAKQGFEARVESAEAVGPVGLAWVSTYGIGYGPGRRVSFLIEANTRFDGRRERITLGPAVHFAPVRGFRVDLGVRFPVTAIAETPLRVEAVLVVRRELFAPW